MPLYFLYFFSIKVTDLLATIETSNFACSLDICKSFLFIFFFQSLNSLHFCLTDLYFQHLVSLSHIFLTLVIVIQEGHIDVCLVIGKPPLEVERVSECSKQCVLPAFVVCSISIALLGMTCCMINFDKLNQTSKDH